MKNKRIENLRAQNLGYRAIAKQLGVSKDAVRDYCRGHGLAGFRGGQEGAPVQEQGCKQCSKIFRPIANDRITFCSRECAFKYKAERKNKYSCVDCGKEISRKAIRCVTCNGLYKRKPKPTVEVKEYECKNCGEVFKSNTTRSKTYCCIKCSKQYAFRTIEVNKSPKLKENGLVDYTITLPRLYKRDQGACGICGRQVDMSKHYNSASYGSIDHIIPVTKGGQHQWDNVQLAHRQCNSEKGERL